MVPDTTLGRRAIAIAMDSWKDGKEAGRLIEGRPRVQVVDTSRKAGQTLQSYEVVGESAEARYRVFVVRLNMANPKEGRTERFFLLGNDPVVVFLEEDYHLISHWDHRMTEEPGEDSPRHRFRRPKPGHACGAVSRGYSVSRGCGSASSPCWRSPA
jgi:hypothetical protein